MRLSFLFLCFIFSRLALATDTVRIYDLNNFAVTGNSNGSFSLNVESPSGDATAETSPATIYVPALYSNGASDNKKYLVNSRDSVEPFKTTSASTSTIAFPLKITVGSTAKYVYSAVKINGNYYVSSNTTGTYSNETNLQLTYNLSPKYFCDTFVLSGTGASNPCSESNTFSTALTVYFFLSNNVYSAGTNISPSTEAGGIYFSIKMSNFYYDSSTNPFTVTLSGARKGDGRMMVDYAASGVMSNFSKVKAYIFNANPAGGAATPIGLALPGSIYADTLATSQSGEVTINALTNGVTYYVSLFFVDKYGFATILSSDVSATPTEIQELLKKQACYLLTAGFGEEHYVINYFRHFRDTVLVNSRAGKLFIHYYYITAPTFAPTIYKSPFLRAVFRGIGYSLYFLFNYAMQLIIGLFLVLIVRNLGKMKVGKKTLRL